MLKNRAGLGCQLAHAAERGAAELEKRRGQVLLELFLQKRMYHTVLFELLTCFGKVSSKHMLQL